MSTDLAHHIQGTPLVDTHEHLDREHVWLDDGPDILQDLFGNYVPADLNTAGASPDAMKRLMDGSDPDIAERLRVSERRGTRHSSLDTAKRCDSSLSMPTGLTNSPEQI